MGVLIVRPSYYPHSEFATSASEAGEWRRQEHQQQQQDAPGAVAPVAAHAGHRGRQWRRTGGEGVYAQAAPLARSYHGYAGLFYTTHNAFCAAEIIQYDVARFLLYTIMYSYLCIIMLLDWIWALLSQPEEMVTDPPQQEPQVLSHPPLFPSLSLSLSLSISLVIGISLRPSP